MKNYILESINYDLCNKDEFRIFEELKQRYENVPEMPSHLIPGDSVFREFIGKE